MTKTVMLFWPCSIFACFRVISSVFLGKWKKGTSALMNGIRGRAQRFSGRPISCDDPIGPTTSMQQTHLASVLNYCRFLALVSFSIVSFVRPDWDKRSDS